MDTIIKGTLREIEPLRDSDSVAVAARRIIAQGLPGMPVVDGAGHFVGIFGEREFMRALFPAYVGTLGSTAMISRTIDELIERRDSCGDEAIRDYLTTDNVVVADEYSDTQLAELFLHHRVVLIPIATAGRVHAVVTRSDFFREIAQRICEPLDDLGD